MDPDEPRSIDLLDGDFYVTDPYPTYVWLRQHDPIHHDTANDLLGVSRYDDIVTIERDKATFISSGTERGYRPNIAADRSIIGLDDPHHTARRNLVSRRFTPRAAGRWEDHVRGVVTGLIDAVLPAGEAEVIADLAAPLPAQMIGLLLGFGNEMWPKLQDWSERTIALGGGPRYHDHDGVAAAMEFAGAAADLYEAKKPTVTEGCPMDDVMTVWIDRARRGLDGYDFGLDEMISDCLLLLVAGPDRDSGHLGVDGGRPAHVVDRRHPADELLGGHRHVGAATQQRPLVGALCQFHERARYHGPGGLGAAVQQE